MFRECFSSWIIEKSTISVLCSKAGGGSKRPHAEWAKMSTEGEHWAAAKKEGGEVTSLPRGQTKRTHVTINLIAQTEGGNVLLNGAYRKVQ